MTAPRFNKHELATLAFYAKYEGWHSFKQRDRATSLAVNRLAAWGYLDLNEKTGQARFTGKITV